MHSCIHPLAIHRLEKCTNYTHYECQVEKREGKTFFKNERHSMLSPSLINKEMQDVLGGGLVAISSTEETILIKQL